MRPNDPTITGTASSNANDVGFRANSVEYLAPNGLSSDQAQKLTIREVVAIDNAKYAFLDIFMEFFVSVAIMN